LDPGTDADAGPRVYDFRPVRQQFENFRPPFGVPRFEIVRTAMKESKALPGLLLLAFDKRVKASECRALPAFSFISRCCNLQGLENVDRLHASSSAGDGRGAQPSQEFTSSKWLPHGITPFSGWS